jgi:hypothetical protein
MIHYVIKTSHFIAQPIRIHSGQLHSKISGVCHHMLLGTWAEEDCHLTLYGNLADDKFEMSSYEKLKGFILGNQEGQKKGPPCQTDCAGKTAFSYSCVPLGELCVHKPCPLADFWWHSVAILVVTAPICLCTQVLSKCRKCMWPLR